MAKLEIDIADITKVVERIRIDKAGTKTVDRDIAIGVLEYLQARNNERMRKQRSPLILPNSH